MDQADMSTRKEIISNFYSQADEDRPDFFVSDEDFKALSEWYLAFSEKRELLGNTNHLLYICRKQPSGSE